MNDLELPQSAILFNLAEIRLVTGPPALLVLFLNGMVAAGLTRGELASLLLGDRFLELQANHRPSVGVGPGLARLYYRCGWHHSLLSFIQAWRSSTAFCCWALEVVY